MAFCGNCGNQMIGAEKFCRNCGNGLSEQPQIQQVSLTSQPSVPVQEEDSDSSPIISQAVAETSRLSRAGVEKFLDSGERIVYATPNRVRSPTGERFGYVTNKRVLLYNQAGHLIKRDKLEEWYLNHIRKLRLEEIGTIRKSLVLIIEDMKMQGGRQGLLSFYKSIQAARA